MACSYIIFHWQLCQLKMLLSHPLPAECCCLLPEVAMPSDLPGLCCSRSSLPHCRQNKTAAVHYLSCLLQPLWQAFTWKCWAVWLEGNHWPSAGRCFKELISRDGQMKLVYIRPQRSLWAWFSTIMQFSCTRKQKRIWELGW